MQRVKTSLSIRMKTDALLAGYEWWGARNKHTHRKAVIFLAAIRMVRRKKQAYPP